MARARVVELLLAAGLAGGGVFTFVFGGVGYLAVSLVPALVVGSVAWFVPSRAPARALFAAALNLAIGTSHVNSVMGPLIFWPLWLVGVVGFFLAVWPASARSIVAALFGTIFLVIGAFAMTMSLYDHLVAQGRDRVVPIDAKWLAVSIIVGALGALCFAFAHPTGSEETTPRARYGAFLAAFAAVPLTAASYLVLVKLGLPLSA